MILKKLVVTLASFFALLNFTSGSILSAPSHLTIGEVGSRSINISWTRPAHDGNSSQLNYTVFYGVSDKSVLQFVEVESVTKATLVVKPFREYEIFVMAKNNDGYGPPSEKKRSTRTPVAVPESCPDAKHIYVETNGDDLDVIISKPVPEEDHNGKITQYVIFFKSINMTVPENITVDAIKPNPDIFYKLKNMGYAKNYGFKVAAVNSAGLCKGWKSLKLVYQICPPVRTVSPSTSPPPSTPEPPTTTEAIVVPSTIPLIETTTSAPEENTSPKRTDPITEIPSPVEKLASTSESSWLIYILIALAVIVAIMGITIFLLIWQLYKNHRFYKLRKEQYKMNNTTPNIGTDNEAQDNPV